LYSRTPASTALTMISSEVAISAAQHLGDVVGQLHDEVAVLTLTQSRGCSPHRMQEGAARLILLLQECDGVESGHGDFCSSDDLVVL
jgi:hypothetical protein